MVADDGGLARGALGAVGCGEIAEFERRGIAIRQLALPGIDRGDRSRIGQQQIERDVFAIANRAHDRAAGMVFPVGRGDRLGRMVVGDGLADEAANRLGVEHLVGIAQHVDDRLVAQTVRIGRIDLAACVLIGPGAGGLGADSHVAIAGAARCVEGQMVRKDHEPRLSGG